ncbi:MAG: hypothetical protein JRJ44_00050 [Deltaproteobacteria bacterium]|nr:hypothetical protein [Deltaproteobacteria bacterium]
MKYKFSRKDIIILSILLLVISTILYFARYALKPKEDDILLKNVEAMQQNIEDVRSGIEDIRDIEKGLIKKKIEEATKEQFQEDEAFLSEIIDLKKKKMIAELRRDIESLSSANEPKKREPIKTKSKPLIKKVIPKTSASGFIRVFAINYLKKKAVIVVNNTNRVVKEGDNISGYTLLEVKENHIIVKKEGMAPESIYLGYGANVPKKFGKSKQ